MSQKFKQSVENAFITVQTLHTLHVSMNGMKGYEGFRDQFSLKILIFLPLTLASTVFHHSPNHILTTVL